MSPATSMAPLPVLMLHGIGSTAVGWAPQVEAWSASRRAASWNAPGYADSPPLNHAEPLIEDYAVALRDWMDGLGVAQAHLVASSWGSLIALAFAATHPDRVARLVLSGPTAGAGHLPERERTAMLRDRGDRARQAGVAAMLATGASRLVAPGADEATLGRVARARQGVETAGYLQALYSLIHARGTDLISAVKSPVLIVAGEDDLIAPPAQHAQRLAAAAPNARLVHFARCGHLPHAEHPGPFTKEALSFINS